MRYVGDHRRQTHSRIVENASYGLRQNGAEGLSVVELMKLAGLTHGGFYNHFESRAALVGEAIAFAMDQMVERWKKLANRKASGDRFETLIADYLSSRHRDNPRQGCALPALAADVARSSPSEQRALASKLEEMIDILVEVLPAERPQPARQIATSAIATMVGSSSDWARAPLGNAIPVMAIAAADTPISEVRSAVLIWYFSSVGWKLARRRAPRGLA